MNVEIISGVSKKTNKEYECVKVSVGTWSKLIFVSPFELTYIKSVLNDFNLEDEIKKHIEIQVED